MAARTRVLVVDDDMGNRLTLGALLEDAGFEVDDADTADRTLEAIGSSSYDFVLLDRNLGDVDGLALVPRVRAALPHAKVVLVSGCIENDGGAVDATFQKGERFDVLVELLRGLSGADRGA